MKTKEEWLCKECGHTQAKWSGSCYSCKNWNTLEVFTIAPEPKNVGFHQIRSKPIALPDVAMMHFERIPTKMNEVDRVLGGGVVLGSLTLLGGDPGIGKSTLMLMLANHFCLLGKKVLYVCGEESAQQTSLRAKRIGVKAENLYLLAETEFGYIKKQIEETKPDIFILDSIQIAYRGDLPSLPGSVMQVKEIAIDCMHIAKQLGITTFLIGHVTKSGELAGPRVLEHIVDTVLDFEGDPDHGFRILRSHKNRFGPTDEVAMFLMESEGLVEVPNPSALFLQERSKESTGSAIVPTIEGSRAMLIEIQALVAPTPFATSARRATGIDPNRLGLLLAVLEKRMGYHFHNLDVFVSIVGGMKIREPSIDLGICLAIASSFCNRPLDPEIAVMGEVGLGGEVRSIPRIEARLAEAKNMGFTRCILPKRCMPKKNLKIELLPVERLDEVIHILLG